MKDWLPQGCCVAAMAVALLAGVGSAAAQEMALDPRKAPPAAEGEEKGNPFLRGTITTDKIGLTAKDFGLKWEEADPPVIVEATKAVPYPSSDEPLALVILIEGDIDWMGNETYNGKDGEGDDTEAFEGAFTGLPAAIDAFPAAGPKGSKGAVIVYSKIAEVKAPMGDLTKLSGAILGTQKDYQEISKSLIVGLEEAWKMLSKEQGYRKVLVVMGSGRDTKEDIAADLKRVVGQLRDLNVESYSIHYTNSDDGPQGLTNMNTIGYTQKGSATSRDHFASKSKTIVEIIGAKYYVDYPGIDLPWDGQEHTFIPVVGGEDLEEVTLVMPEEDVIRPSTGGGGLWWLWLLIILAVVIVVVVIIVLARRKPAPVPVMMPEVPIDVPPQEPAGPKKTVMFNLNAGSEYPVVGWIVPLSGPNQFQTFKLLHGATKIGTGGDAHIIINDGFMSTIHAEIVCKQSGFILVDGGSTNGSFVNDRKISEHELVDNDQFILGKTPFKFKSIN